MEYFNDRTYARGEDVEIEIPIEPESATTGDGQPYDFTYALLRNTDPTSGWVLELRGDAPDIRDDEASVTLRGRVERVGDGDYRIEDGVKGRIPGDTVRFDRIGGSGRVLRVKGEAAGPPEPEANAD
jgi:hypothetical protein